MVKLVVCDIDGTLLGKDQIQLEGDAAKALGALIESGKKVALASGRSYFSMRKVVSSQPYADELYYICDDGAEFFQLFPGNFLGNLVETRIPQQQNLPFHKNPSSSRMFANIKSF